MKARFQHIALEELAEAVSYYKKVDRDLARRFRTIVRTMVANIKRAPLEGAIYIDDVRRRVLSDFPYVIFYIPYEKEILIVAIMHTSREPDNWLDRID